MTTEAAQLQFAAEFSLFIAALAAVVVASLKPDLILHRVFSRWSLVVGSLVLASSAFARGSLLSIDSGLDQGFRALGVVALAASLAGWVGPPLVRLSGGVAVVALGGSELLSRSGSDRWADAAGGLGALAFGLAVVVVARRSIATRVATSAAVVVLIVITTLSMSVSVVIANNVEDEVARRYEARAETESQLFVQISETARNQASLLARALDGEAAANAMTTAIDSPDAATAEAAQASVAAILANFRDAFLQLSSPGPSAVVNADQTSVAAIDASDLVRIELVGSQAVTDVLADRQPAAQVAVVGDDVIAIGAAPIRSASTKEFLGVAVVSALLDDDFLGERVGDPSSAEQGVALALADRNHLYSRAGRQPSLASVLSATTAALRTGERQTTVDGDRFVVAVPVMDVDGVPVFAVVVAVPQSQIDSTRQDLFRILFVVSLGAALVAMVLAGLAGNRVGQGLTLLTDAASKLQAGDFGARADVDSEDELGALGSTFNHMAFSLETMTVDLREAAAAEATLRSRLEAVIGGMGEALVAVDDRGRITDFNAAAEELTHLPARDAVGKRFSAVARLRLEGGAEVTSRLERPLVDAWTTAADLVRSDEAIVPVVVSGGPLRDAAGTLTGAVFVFRDMRRERELDQMKSDFIANISHELRTPITPIAGYSALMMSRDLPAEQVRKFAGEIHNASDRLTRTAEQLVQFATLAAGRLHLDPSVISPQELMADLAVRWADRMDDTFTLSRRVARGTPDILADRHYLNVLLDELIDNSVKYSPNGGRIRVSASVVERGEFRRVLLSVDDQGVGIEAARREVIFDDFSQGDSSSTRRFGGLGLGLALVNRIVRAHGGELSCTSEVGRGTTVRILLPVADGSELEGSDLDEEGRFA